MRPAPAACTVVLLALLPACSGPERPLELGFREVPSDLVLGAQSTPGPEGGELPLGLDGAPPSGPLVLLPPPPSVVTLPPPPFAPPRPGAPPPAPPPRVPTGCPAVDPFQAPEVEAPPSPAGPPAAAQYVFANDGSFSVSGANARTDRFPEATVREVRDVSGAAEEFTYSVAETIGDTATTTRYRMVSASAVPGGTGWFVQRMDWLRADGASASFTPTPPLKLASFPLVRGETADQQGVDPGTQTSMRFTTTVTGKERVTACGQPLDAWTVDLTNGRLLTPTSDLEFTATYFLGTQFGGVVLRDSVVFRGTDAGAGVQRSNLATITSVPATP